MGCIFWLGGGLLLCCSDSSNMEILPPLALAAWNSHQTVSSKVSARWHVYKRGNINNKQLVWSSALWGRLVWSASLFLAPWIPALAGPKGERSSTHQVSWSSAAKKCRASLGRGLSLSAFLKKPVRKLLVNDWSPKKKNALKESKKKNFFEKIFPKCEKVALGKSRENLKKFSQVRKNECRKSQETLAFELHFSTDCGKGYRRGERLLLRSMH